MFTFQDKRLRYKRLWGYNLVGQNWTHGGDDDDDDDRKDHTYQMPCNAITGRWQRRRIERNSRGRIRLANQWSGFAIWGIGIGIDIGIGYVYVI